MIEYKDLYYQLFNEVTDVIEKLKEIQCRMEDLHAIKGNEDESVQS